CRRRYRRIWFGGPRFRPLARLVSSWLDAANSSDATDAIRSTWLVLDDAVRTIDRTLAGGAAIAFEGRYTVLSRMGGARRAHLFSCVAISGRAAPRRCVYRFVAPVRPRRYASSAGR